MTLSTFLAALTLWWAVASAGPDWSGRAPDVEVASAIAVVKGAFGKEIFEESVQLADSGLIGSDNGLKGYFVCFRYFPRDAQGCYVVLCVVRDLAGTYTGIEGAALPNCVEAPETCSVEILAAEALEIVRGDGFQVAARDTRIWLVWTEQHDCIAWKVQSSMRGSCDDGQSHYLIDAGTGTILRRPSMEHLPVRR